MAGKDVTNPRGSLFQFVTINGSCCVGKIEVVDAVHRHQVNMKMGDLEARNHQPNPGRVEDLVNRKRNRLRHIEEVIT